MDKISRLYKSLSDNQRYNFWSAATNLFLCMFTFWLGITIQFIVVDKTTDYQSKLIYREFEKYITPQYNNLLRAQSNATKILYNIDENKLKEIASRFKNGKMTKEDDRYIANYINSFISDYKDYMLYVDTIVDNAMSLKYVLPKDKQNKINSYCRGILVERIAVDILLESNSIDDFSNKVKAYISSDKFIHNTRTAINPNALEKINKEIVSIYTFGHIQGTERIGLFVYLDILDKALKVSTIYNDELGYFGKKKYTIDKLWNNVPLFYKSFLVLICTIVIGYLFCRWFLRKLSLPSDPNRGYTAEQYKSIKKERDNVYKIFENQNEIKRLREEITKNNISLRKKVYKHEDDIRLWEELTKEKDIKIKTLEEEIKKIEEEINNINK